MNATQTNRQANAEAMLRVGAYIDIALNATTGAEADSIGYTPVGNIIGVTPTHDVQTVDAFANDEGTLRKIRHDVSQGSLMYDVKTNEFTKLGVQFLFGASQLGTFSQTIKSGVVGDTLAFATAAAALGNWYLLKSSTSRILQLTNLAVATAAAANVTANATTDKITHTGHGYENGQAVVFGGTAVPAGLTAGVTYFVINKGTDDYEVAATAGGTKIDLTDAGTSVTERPALVPGTDFEADLRSGAVRFLTAQSADRYPILTAPAIAADATNGYFTLVPGATYEFNGMGRARFYDKRTNPLPLIYEGFSVQLTLKNAAELALANFADLTFSMLVGDTVGLVYARNAIGNVT